VKPTMSVNRTVTCLRSASMQRSPSDLSTKGAAIFVSVILRPHVPADERPVPRSYSELSHHGIDVDDVPWKDDLVTEPPRIENGHLIMPTKPGWGADINEDAVKRHPPK
jgi:L-alanine-DL-glutamate epimerase-like enolase superfamily enzyme